MLCLEYCKLGEGLSIVGKLKKLRVLSLSGSDIEKLPVELKHLTKLQLLDISNCSKLEEIPSNVISSLISLEELCMRNTFVEWEFQGRTNQSEKASLSELGHVNQFTNLDIQIPNAALLPKNMFFNKRSSYKIVIGDLNADTEINLKMPEKFEASRYLAIHLKEGFDIHSRKGVKLLFETVQHLSLEDLDGVNDLFYSLNLNGFPYLKHLLIAYNSNIQYLIGSKERQHFEKVFRRLKSLHLYNLKNLRNMCSCKLSAPSFGCLKEIKINLCGRLKQVFIFSMISLLTVLETIEVSECNALEEIVPLEVQSNNLWGVQSNNQEIMLLKFPELRSLTLMSLPELIGFYPIRLIEGESTELFHEKVGLKLWFKFIYLLHSNSLHILLYLYIF
jgi:Leucine-rich repeat (LRR) protein